MIPRLLFVFVFVVCACTFPSNDVYGQQALSLTTDQRVYDLTGDSLTDEQILDLERQLTDLVETGPNAIVVVRNLVATPEETLEQVEMIQQEWASTAGIDDDLAVAILINRNPDDTSDARAGIYVGMTLDDGNVPEREQRAIVDEELIPPLRDGNVYASLERAIGRLSSSYVNGPPRTRFDKWADRASTTWLVPASLITAALLTGISGLLFRKREVRTGLPLPITTQRPDLLPAAMGSALALGRPQPSAVPATILHLAEGGALAFDQEADTRRFSKPKLAVRILNPNATRDEIDEIVMRLLEKRAEDGIVSSKNLQKVAADTYPTQRWIDREFRDRGWTTRQIAATRNWLIAIFAILVPLTIASAIISINGGNRSSLVGAAGLAGAGIVTIWLYSAFSPFTTVGLEVAEPWKAYRDGLSAVLKQESAPIDLNAVLIDAVAMNLGHRAEKRVKAADEAGLVLNAFSASSLASAYPTWRAFNSTMPASGSGSTVSGGGAGGGGGAAGST